MKGNHVEFVSYTGSYPNLCMGILTLKIDGELVKFGYDFHYEKECLNNYESFWSSGGKCGFRNNWSESYINTDEWIIDEDALPKCYRKYAKDIAEEFNSNVRYGCCGGCL